MQPNSEKRVTVFFYGAFIRPEIMAKGGIKPEGVEVARLSGFDIHITSHADLKRSDQHSVYGVIVKATHQELNRLYTMDGVGTFLPEAVLVETYDGRFEPALCFIPPSHQDAPADTEYLETMISAAHKYGFPDWYLKRLARFHHREK